MSAGPTYIIITREERGRPKLATTVDGIPPRFSQFEYVVVARLPYRELDNGLPAGTELSRVTNLETQLEEALAPLGAFHLGHITFNGAMQVAFLAPKGVPTELTVKTGLLRKEKIELDVRHDPSHTWFQTELAPTDMEVETFKNRQLHQTLAEHGDRSEAIRQVDFWAYFASAEQRASFVNAIVSNGYRITSENAAEGAYAFGCQFAADSDVTPQTMATRCAFLRKEATGQNGDFDGWACPVVKL